MVFKTIISFIFGLYRLYPVLPMGKTDCFTQFYPTCFTQWVKLPCQPWSWAISSETADEWDEIPLPYHDTALASHSPTDSIVVVAFSESRCGCPQGEGEVLGHCGQKQTRVSFGWYLQTSFMDDPLGSYFYWYSVFDSGSVVRITFIRILTQNLSIHSDSENLL